MNETRINWQVTIDAMRLCGYELCLDAIAPGFADVPTDTQLVLWDHFCSRLHVCRLECAWKGGGPCRSMECPRRVLHLVRLAP